MSALTFMIDKSKIVFIVFAFCILAGCVTNPVTGKDEVRIISEAWELKTGREQYTPSRQSQGGDYLADEDVQKYVNDVGQKLAAVSDRDLPYEFSVINNSVPNAWALPGGKISINRGLLTELESESELAAVLGHEIVHAAARHGAKGVERGTIIQATTVIAGVASAKSEYNQYVAIGAGIGAQLINSRYDRNAERESDLYGMNYMSRAGYDPQGAVDLQQTFVDLSKDKNANFISGLFASHPPSKERLQANQSHANQLPKGGVVGEKRYKKAIARLIETKPAYDAYDEARKLAKNNQRKKAKQLIGSAIKMEPRESHFHSFLGDLEFDANNYQRAQRSFSEAASLNPRYFYPHLRSGLTSEKRGSLTRAISQLKRSIELLPTPQAYNALGNISKRQGDTNKAREYYAAASKGSGSASETALDSLIKIDLAQDPGAYITLRYSGSLNQILQIEMTNRAPRAFKKISLSIRYVDENGNIRTVRKQIYALDKNEIKLINTGLISLSSEVRLSILSASLVET